MPMVSHIDVDPVRNNGSLSMARAGDLAARWGALEACRHYLQLVVGQNRLSKGIGEPATSDLVQDTILEGWRGFAPIRGPYSGTTSRLAPSDLGPQFDQGTAAT